MSVYYIGALQCQDNHDLLHFGKGHDDSPPGRGSGRYAWGSGEQPKQKKGFSGYIAKRKQKKAQAEAQAIAQKRVEAMNKAKELEENKTKILMSGSATQVLQYKGRWTNNELDYITKRLDFEEKIQKRSADEMNSAFDTLNKTVKKLSDTTTTTSNFVKAGTDLYNGIARIYNSTEEGKKKPLTIVDTSNQQKKQQQNQGGNN
jgi:hypothetical protein